MATTIGAVLDREKLSGRQLGVLALTSLAIIVDGFDIQTLAFAGPVILKEWGLTKADLGPAIAAALIGMAVGGPLGGALGDRIGRRLAIVFSAIFFGIATLLTGQAQDLQGLILFRFISGLGFGALLPNATALLAEWMPERHRGPAIALMIIGVPVGGMLGAAVSSWLIPTYGWRACFAVGGVLGILLAAILALSLPESLRFLMRRPGGAEKVAATLRKTFPAFGGDTLEPEPAPTKAPLADIFQLSHARVTFGLALAFFMNLMATYAFFNWVPTLLTSMGMALDVSIRGAFYFNLWGLPGAIVGGLLVTWVGSRRGILAMLAVALMVTAFMGITINAGQLSETGVMIGLSVAGASITGLQACLYALAASAYPTTCRSTGLGFVAGFGRLGAVASAFTGGAVLALANGHGIFFVVVAVVLVLAATGVLVVDRHTVGRQRLSGAPQGQPS